MQVFHNDFHSGAAIWSHDDISEETYGSYECLSF